MAHSLTKFRTKNYTMKNNTPKEISSAHANVILDSIADGVFTVDENMKIAYFNQAAERITGVSRQKAIGRYCFEILKANICEKTCALRCTFETGEQIIDKQVNILHADGKQIPIRISTAVLKNEKGQIVGGVESFRDLSIVEELKKEIQRSYTFEDIVSKNHRILQIFDILPNIAESESTVLIQGPSGSGKELFARAIHNLSPRNSGPFIAINCGALPETLIESELFGFVKGAFTDAKKDKPGRFALANNGSIFLDEVDSLTMATQVKLLRVLQEKEYEPLGATSSVKTNVRIISATKEDLSELVAKEQFRVDLFYRLNVVKLDLPSLKERRDDIPLLVNHFIERFNKRMGRDISSISDEGLTAIMGHDFDGNIRELENIIEHAFVMCHDKIIEKQHLPPELLQPKSVPKPKVVETNPLQNAERKQILAALEEHDWNKVETAKALGLHRTSLWRKMKKYGLE